MNREDLVRIMNKILEKQNRPAILNDAQNLRDAGFRSLDFSEMALRVEREAGRELNFSAALMRSISTVGDVLNFFENALASS